jgi:hypothetical protein
MIGNEDRKIWRARDVSFYTPESPPSEEELKKANKFFSKFKPDVAQNKSAATTLE